MARTIKEVTQQLPVQSIAIRVAAYARVSSGKDAMLHSLSAQVSYYSQYIQNHPGWIYCGVYSDEAFTGTKENREGFQELLKECRAGNIDLIITKSISRFARNTVTLLETVRELKQLGVDVYFEEQNIHTLSADGELMLTILASYAQEESRSASENQKWRIRKTFEEGKPWRGRMLGYRLVDGTYQVIPKEAEVVRWIYQEYLSGKGYITLAKELNESGRFTRDGNPWAVFTVRKILHNYSYTGNLLLQTTYRENHITKKTLRNKGQYPMFHVVGAHEPIVSLEDFEKVQRLADSKADHFKCNGEKGAYPFTGKLICKGCGKHYRRKKTKVRPVWICQTFNTMGKAYCPTSKQIPEETLMAVTAEVLGLSAFDEHIFAATVRQICVGENNSLSYHLRDGKVVETTWVDRSRAESWTLEMKEAARQKDKIRRQSQCQEQ